MWACSGLMFHVCLWKVSWVLFLYEITTSVMKSRVSDQNGLSPLYVMLEIHHSGREPSKYRDENMRKQYALVNPVQV